MCQENGIGLHAKSVLLLKVKSIEVQLNIAWSKSSNSLMISMIVEQLMEVVSP